MNAQSQVRGTGAADITPIRVTVWGENHHETNGSEREAMAERYPLGMHGTIAAGIRERLGSGVVVRTATQDQAENGLTKAVLEDTDVLTWWGHVTHAEVADDVVERVYERVLGGMGLLVLHSAHFSKIFKRLMGTTCSLRWRNSDDAELVWTIAPSHPIARGLPQPVIIPQQEMYGEYFDIPTPDELVFLSSFSGGELFRSGCTWRKGKGKVFYFSPGDQDYPVYHHPDIKTILANAVEWAAPATSEILVPPSVVNAPPPHFEGARLVEGA